MDDRRDDSDRRFRSDGWAAATVRAAAVLVLAVLGLAFLPDRLLIWLGPRTSPRVRDLLVTAWVVIWFVLLARWFVAFQRGRGG